MKKIVNEDRKLAIVIPAYKNDFFKEAIESIANQTCKNFTLYIGDDKSPYGLYNIVKEYEDKIHLVYKCFDENLGGKDLAGQYSRCVDLTQDEEWIWLFSDDDVMDLNCVETFYKYLDKGTDNNLLHFNIKTIDKNGNVSKNNNPFPKQLSITDFFAKRTKLEIHSVIVEFIFKKSLYVKENGFTNYDLAWCADDATWMKFSRVQGIETMSGAFVNWRYSGINISSILDDEKIVRRKVNSNVDHINWVKNYFLEHNIPDTTTKFEKFKWIISCLFLSPAFSYNEKLKIMFEVIKKLHYSNIIITAFIYLNYLTIKELSLFKKPVKDTLMSPYQNKYDNLSLGEKQAK